MPTAQQQQAPETTPAAAQAPVGTLTRSVALGALASATVVGLPLALGGLLDTVSGAATFDDRRVLEAGRRPGRSWIDGCLALLGAFAWLLPGPIVFGAAWLGAVSASGRSSGSFDALYFALLCATLTYLLAASVFASAGVADFAVRRRWRGMFDVVALRQRLLAQPGFTSAWARSLMAVAIACAAGIAARWLAGSVVVGVMAASVALFLALVPAAFAWASLARSSYGLLAAVPDAEVD